jgi:outer membrane protein assembly factor BamA
VLAPFVLLAWVLAAAQPPERIIDIQVQGNIATPDGDVIRLAGLEPGMTLDVRTLDEAAARLRASRKFVEVEVLKRFASISDLSQITVVIVVDEGAVRIRADGTVDLGPDKPPLLLRLLGFGRRRHLGVMVLPLIKFEDGYGFSYGLRAAIPDVGGKSNRLSFPATWGGEKRAAAEFDRELSTVLSRVQAGASFARRTNPFYQEHDDRGRVWLRGERNIARTLRVGATGEWQHAAFGGLADRFLRTGADVTVDTRIDPILPRNAIVARAAWDRLRFGNAQNVDRTDVDLRGYIGLIGQTVLAVRGQREGANHALPPYLRPLLGGVGTVRGLKFGSFNGDTLVGASADLRVPVSSPLDAAKVGFSAFFDTAAAYDKGQRVRDQHFHQGAGGGVWISLAVLRLDLYVAHGLGGGSTRLHFATAVSF